MPNEIAVPRTANRVAGELDEVLASVWELVPRKQHCRPTCTWQPDGHCPSAPSRMCDPPAELIAPGVEFRWCRPRMFLHRQLLPNHPSVDFRPATSAQST